MVGCWCFSKLWTKGTVKRSLDYMDTSVAGLLCGRWMLSGNQRAGIQAFYPGSLKREVKSDGKHKMRTWHTTNRSRAHHPKRMLPRLHVLYLCVRVCCRAELCRSLQESAGVPAAPPSSVHESGLLVCRSDTGQPSVCVCVCVCVCEGLHWAQATAHVHKSTADLGIGASLELQRLSWEQILKSRSVHWNNGPETFEKSLEIHKHAAESQLFDSFCCSFTLFISLVEHLSPILIRQH